MDNEIIQAERWRSARFLHPAGTLHLFYQLPLVNNAYAMATTLKRNPSASW